MLISGNAEVLLGTFIEWYQRKLTTSAIAITERCAAFEFRLLIVFASTILLVGFLDVARELIYSFVSRSSRAEVRRVRVQNLLSNTLPAGSWNKIEHGDENRSMSEQWDGQPHIRSLEPDYPIAESGPGHKSK